MLYASALAPLTLLLVSIGLGLPTQNWFLEFGLAVVVVSSVTTIMLAFQSGKAAANAKKLTFNDFLPEADNGRSHNFKFTASIMGFDTGKPLDHIQRQINELQKVASQDEDNAIRRFQMIDRRLDICFAQIRHHEQVTLPKLLGGSAGAVALSAVLTIVGSAYLAFPASIYQVFSSCAQRLTSFF